MTEALFTALGDGRFQPAPVARGPWDPDALHGGPVAALVAREAEATLAATGAATTPVRMTIDLERPARVAPITVRSQIVRPGRKVQVAEVTVHDDEGTRLARATVLATRHAPVDLPPGTPLPDDPLPPHRDTTGPSTNFQPPFEGDVFHRDGVEHRFVTGGILVPGPTADWMRLCGPVLDGEAPSPFQRVVAAADFVNGVSSVLPWGEWSFINPDLTVTLHRLPVGEWIGLDATTRVDPQGVGTAEGDLFDERGRVGHCVQTLLIDRLPARP
jgi:uncharacterized protein (TIGR00369 family)